MRMLALLAGVLISTQVLGAQVGLRPYVVNGVVLTPEERQLTSPVPPLFMEAGDTALLELYVTGIEYVGGDPRTGLAGFGVTLHFDPALVELSDPNLVGEDALFDPFLPLGGRSGFLCGFVAPDRCTNDSTDFLTSTGGARLGVPGVGAGDGFLSVSDSLTEPPEQVYPAGDGVLAVFLLTFLATDGAVAASSGPSTSIVLTASSVGDPTKFLIGFDGDTIPVNQVGSLAINPVPLPGAGLALLSALGVLAIRRRRALTAPRA